MRNIADVYGANKFWNQASEEENITLLTRIAKLKSQGIDVEGLINFIDSQIPSKPDDKDFSG